MHTLIPRVHKIYGVIGLALAISLITSFFISHPLAIGMTVTLVDLIVIAILSFTRSKAGFSARLGKNGGPNEFRTNHHNAFNILIINGFIYTYF